MSKPIEIKLGQKFGKLTIISFHHNKERLYGNKKRMGNRKNFNEMDRERWGWLVEDFDDSKI